MLRGRGEPATYSNNTSHDDWDRALHHHIGSENGHGGNSNTRLGSPITVESKGSGQTTNASLVESQRTLHQCLRFQEQRQRNELPIRHVDRAPFYSQVKTMAAVQPCVLTLWSVPAQRHW